VYVFTFVCPLLFCYLLLAVWLLYANGIFFNFLIALNTTTNALLNYLNQIWRMHWIVSVKGKAYYTKPQPRLSQKNLSKNQRSSKMSCSHGPKWVPALKGNFWSSSPRSYSPYRISTWMSCRGPSKVPLSVKRRTKNAHKDTDNFLVTVWHHNTPNWTKY
jgi:hypothetical protein